MLLFVVIVCAILVICFVIRVDAIEYSTKGKPATWRNFWTSKKFAEVAIELLIVIMGIIIGLYFTAHWEEKETKTRVAEMLEVARDDLSQQGSFIGEIIEKYKKKDFDLPTTKINVSLEYNILKDVIEDDVVFITMSKAGCSMLLSTMREAELTYGIFKSKELNEEELCSYIELIIQENDDMIRLLNIEMQRLRGDYSDKEASDEYSKFLQERIGRGEAIFGVDGQVIETP